MTPYVATATDVVERFCTTPKRLELLDRWLAHRSVLRRLGFDNGFQWIDGSFVEDKEPNDIDVVTYFHRPSKHRMVASLERILKANPKLFSRTSLKQHFGIDGFFVDLDGTKNILVDSTRYFTGLFSHRRSDNAWKGMVQVKLDCTDKEASDWLLARSPEFDDGGEM